MAAGLRWVLLGVTLLHGCVLDWDRQWDTGPGPGDGAGEKKATLEQGPAPDGPADSKVAPPKDKGKKDTAKPDKTPACKEGAVCRSSKSPCDPVEKCTAGKCPADVVWMQKVSAYYTKPNTDGFVMIHGSGKQEVWFDKLVHGCKPDEDVTGKLAFGRSFVSFDTRTLAAPKKVVSLRLTGCLLGGDEHNKHKADIYLASFALPATAKAYASETKNLKTKLPNTMGVQWVALPVHALQPKKRTQLLFRWPVTTCTAFTGQLWAGASTKSGIGSGAC